MALELRIADPLSNDLMLIVTCTIVCSIVKRGPEHNTMNTICESLETFDKLIAVIKTRTLQIMKEFHTSQMANEAVCSAT